MKDATLNYQECLAWRTLFPNHTYSPTLDAIVRKTNEIQVQVNPTELEFPNTKLALDPTRIYRTVLQ